MTKKHEPPEGGPLTTSTSDTSNTQATLIPGDEFIFTGPTHTEAVWGDGDQILWSADESLMITGEPNSGKSLLVQQVLLARMGIGPAKVLGLTVTPDVDRKVLYLTLDRPVQIRRSMRRMVNQGRDQHTLADTLLVCPDLGVKLTDNPAALRDLCLNNNVGTVGVDSLYNLGANLKEDVEVDLLNRAWKLCEAAGIRVVLLHHTRKRSQRGGAEKTLDGVYGSTFLSAACGNVLGIFPDKDDRDLGELIHMKTAVDRVGPLALIHDHIAGRTTTVIPVGILDVLAQAHPTAMTIKDIALGAGMEGTDAVRKKLERKLKQFEKAKRVEKGDQFGLASTWKITSTGLGLVQNDVHMDTHLDTPGHPTRKPNKDGLSDLDTLRTGTDASAVVVGLDTTLIGGGVCPDQTTTNETQLSTLDDPALSPDLMPGETEHEREVRVNALLDAWSPPDEELAA